MSTITLPAAVPAGAGWRSRRTPSPGARPTRTSRRTAGRAPRSRSFRSGQAGDPSMAESLLMDHLEHPERTDEQLIAEAGL